MDFNGAAMSKQLKGLSASGSALKVMTIAGAVIVTLVLRRTRIGYHSSSYNDNHNDKDDIQFGL
jgi:hypothetical protein